METENTPDPTETLSPMPAAVANAICAVMSDLKTIGKENKNVHGNYKFTSIDDFLEEVRPLCATHGLIILQEEDDVEVTHSVNKKNEPTTWVKIRYEFRLSHKSGAMYERPLHRTIMINATMGPQAFGAAQSYCLKNFERSLFQIATGDADLDDDKAHGDYTGYQDQREQKPGGGVRAAGSNGLSKDTRRPPMWSGELSPQELTERMNTLREDLPAMDEVDLLVPALNYNQKAFDQCAKDMPKLWAEMEPLIDKQKQNVGL